MKDVNIQVTDIPFHYDNDEIFSYTENGFNVAFALVSTADRSKT